MTTLTWICAIVLVFVGCVYLGFRTSLKRVQTIPVPLQASSATPTVIALEILVLSDSTVSVGGRAVERSTLAAVLSQLHKDGTRGIRVRRKAIASYDALLGVLDEIRKAGFVEVSIDAEET